MSKTAVQFRHNGSDVAVFVDGGANLLTTLRDGIGDTAPKYGCGQGTCGVCTVLIDGEPHLSCLTLAETCQGRSVETADGLKNGPRAASAAGRVHGAFRRPMRVLHAGHADGRQGVARPQSVAVTREDVVEAISGNICRCTGYEPIINAVLAAASARGARRA